MVALAVRVRISSGFSSTSVTKPLASRVTLSVSLSDKLALEADQLAAAMHESQQLARACSRSTWLRSSGRLRSEARSPRLSSKRRNRRSSVSLRLTTTSIVEKPTLASCGAAGGSTSRAGAEDAAHCGAMRGGRGSRGRPGERGHDREQADLQQCMAVRVESPGMADLMKIGTIYTT